MQVVIVIVDTLFLSTLSLRRATRRNSTERPIESHFYPRSPCGERPSYQRPCEHPTTDFYPRSPCGERHTRRSIKTELDRFLSTLSLRRATRLCTILYSCPGNFYPRSPCGERHQQHWPDSTRRRISIHALLAESDDTSKDVIKTARNFYPRSPCGERHANLRRHRSNDDFYPRSPCGERLASVA